MQRPDLDLRRRLVLCQREQDGHRGVQVLAGPHPSHVAMQAAECERVARAGDDVGCRLEAVERVLRRIGHEL